MANNGVEYKCPKCTGPLHYSAVEQKMQCEYCQSIFEVAEVEAMYQNEIQQAQSGEADGIKMSQPKNGQRTMLILIIVSLVVLKLFQKLMNFL